MIAALFRAVTARLPGTLAMAMALVTTPVTAADGAIAVSQPYRLSPHVAPGETTMGIRLLGSVELTPISVAGLPLGGLSGIAWDEDESRLYALSDRGSLFHLRPTFDNDTLSERLDDLEQRLNSTRLEQRLNSTRLEQRLNSTRFVRSGGFSSYASLDLGRLASCLQQLVSAVSNSPPRIFIYCSSAVGF